MKPFTRDKKPDLWHIFLMTSLTAAGLFALNFTKAPSRLIWANAILTVYFFLLVVSLFIAFCQQVEYDLYSYDVILYSGFSLFFCFMVLNHAYMTVQCVRSPETFTVDDILFTLLNSAQNYLQVTTPLLVFFSIVTLVTNLIMLFRSKDFLFDNFFGIILSLTILGGLGVVAVYRFLVYVTGESHLFGVLLINLSAAVFLYFECQLIGTIIAILIAAEYRPDPDKDVLIVLGGGLERDGTPTSQIQKRLNAAIAFSEYQNHKNGKEPLFVVSGGQGPDEIQSEAASMKAYLIGKNVKEDRIIMEDKSTSTVENMMFSRDLIRKIKPDARLAFVTTNFHVFRAGLYASKLGMKAHGIGAPMNRLSWPNAVAREFISLFVGEYKKQVFFFIVLILTYTVLTVLTFQK